MVQGKNAKTTSLILTCLVITLQCLDIPIESTGVYTGSPAYTHFIYPFFHDGFIHVLLNCWCLLSVVFLYDTTMSMLFIAYICTVSYPTYLFTSTIPTVGLSGFCYVLLGSISFSVGQKYMYQVYMIISIGSGFLLPFFNPWLHLYSYVVGLLVGFLNKPINDERRDR